MPTLSDTFNLNRFVQAQAGIYDHAYGELVAGKKRSHWMWFVFPQIAGLGHSPMAQRYAIGCAEEAAEYLAHDVLGPRLERCTDAMLAHGSQSAKAILGSPDDLKFQSCMTLFGAVSSGRSVFEQALETFFGGLPDQGTLSRLAGRV
jgi:uncharacterized protein (DUF1810 family)